MRSQCGNRRFWVVTRKKRPHLLHAHRQKKKKKQVVLVDWFGTTGASSCWLTPPALTNHWHYLTPESRAPSPVRIYGAPTTNLWMVPHRGNGRTFPSRPPTLKHSFCRGEKKKKKKKKKTKENKKKKKKKIKRQLGGWHACGCGWGRNYVASDLPEFQNIRSTGRFVRACSRNHRNKFAAKRPAFAGTGRQYLNGRLSRDLKFTAHKPKQGSLFFQDVSRKVKPARGIPFLKWEIPRGKLMVFLQNINSIPRCALIRFGIKKKKKKKKKGLD